MYLYSNVSAIDVNGNIGHDGSNWSAVAMQSAEVLKSPSVSITLPRLNQIFGQFGSILAASLIIFSAKRGSPRMWCVSPSARNASVWLGLADTAFRKHCLASFHCDKYT